MRHSEKIAPVAAAMTALTTLACCLPLAFAGAAATASLAAVAATYSAFFLGAAVILLGVGCVQIGRRGPRCAVRSTSSLVVLLISAVVVALVLFFPQVVAGVLADWGPS